MKQVFFTLVFFIACIHHSVAQEDSNETVSLNPDVALTTKHYDDKIVLRWAPINSEWWLYGMLEGYSIARKDMSELSNKYEVLVDTIRPWTQLEMEDWYRANPDDEEVAVPLKTMYLEWENTNATNSNLSDLFEKSENFEQRYHMTILSADMFPVVADAAGLRWVDTTAEKDKLYSYRVTFNKSDASRGSYAIAKKWDVLEKPVIFEAREKEGRVVIAWDRKLHQSQYTAYHIERSADNTSFERLNKHPYIQGVGDGLTSGTFISYMDRVENYQLYYYRIIGIDAFGDESEPSEPFLAEGKDRTPPKAEKPSGQKSEGGDANLISWSHKKMDEITQVVIYKKDPTTDGKLIYNALASDGFDFEIEDTEIEDGMSMYSVILVDTAGNYAQSIPVELYKKDETPPQPPLNLKANPDTTGRVVLTWDQGPDLDVIGYYIFTAPRRHDNFVKLNQQRHLYRIYEDSINMNLLTEKRFYKIVSVDKGGNIGEYSEILEVNLPDKIPPAPCLFFDYRVDSAGIFLGVMPSSSADVVAHKLYRKPAKTNDWTMIKEFDQNPPDIIKDDKLESGVSYVYKWIAEDEGGLQSSAEHSMLSLTAFDMRMFYRPQLRLTKTKEGIKIEATQDVPGEDFRIQIIRSFKGRKYRTLTTISEGFEYLDKADTSKDIEVKYRAKVLYKDGTRSKFGKEVAL